MLYFNCWEVMSYCLGFFVIGYGVMTIISARREKELRKEMDELLDLIDRYDSLTERAGANTDQMIKNFDEVKDQLDRLYNSYVGVLTDPKFYEESKRHYIQRLSELN